MISFTIPFVAKKNCLFQKSGKPQLITKKAGLLLSSCWWRHNISNVFSLQYFTLTKGGLLPVSFTASIRDLVSKTPALATGKYCVGHCRRI